MSGKVANLMETNIFTLFKYLSIYNVELYWCPEMSTRLMEVIQHGGSFSYVNNKK